MSIPTRWAVAVATGITVAAGGVLSAGTAAATPGTLTQHGNSVTWQTTVSGERSWMCHAYVMDSNSQYASQVAASPVQTVPPGGSVTMTMTVPDGHYFTGWVCRRDGGEGVYGRYVPQDWVPIYVPA